MPLRPPRLRAGARIGVVSPSYWIEPERLDRAVGVFEAAGYELVIGPSVTARQHKFAGTPEERAADIMAMFEDSAIDAIEINISCPNVKEGGVAFGNDPEMSARVVAACRKHTNKPLITKLSPNQTDIQENARLCIEAGTDGFSVINTLMGMAIDTATRRPIIGNTQGGLSGPAIKPIALLKVHQVYQVAKAHGVPIIGQGGITTVNDAIEFLVAGAAAIGIGTALFYDPLVCDKINAGIAEYLAQHGFASVTELTGSLQT